jgi:1,4-alpha-glucan branching enzyme
LHYYIKQTWNSWWNCFHLALFILRELGVNCIELMPCHEFNELEYYSYNVVQGDYR